MFKIVGAGVVLFMLSSCIVHEPHGRRMPPGHAKRYYGGSARYYAPGHVKKYTSMKIVAIITEAVVMDITDKIKALKFQCFLLVYYSLDFFGFKSVSKISTSCPNLASIRSAIFFSSLSRKSFLSSSLSNTSRRL